MNLKFSDALPPFAFFPTVSGQKSNADPAVANADAQLLDKSNTRGYALAADKIVYQAK